MASSSSSIIMIVMVQILLGCLICVSEPPSEEKQGLLAFINNVPHSRRLVWNATASPCSWVGVRCDVGLAHVVSLHLPAVGLVGAIPTATIGRLAGLRVLSLRSNLLSGGLPPDFGNLTSLHSLYLQNNRFSGEFPRQLAGLVRLTRLDLSFNRFAGKVPVGIGNRLTGLFLQNNRFSGVLPNISTRSLVGFNVSNNGFSGEIPAGLRRFPASSFAGNVQLCGSPLSPCTSPSKRPPPPPPPPSASSNNLSRTAIIIISAAAGAALLLLAIVIALCCVIIVGRRRRRPHTDAGVAVSSRDASAKDDVGSSETASGEQKIRDGDSRLVFVSGGARRFDLEDMLRASAEVIGKGSTGTTFRAALEDETVVAVKRLRDVAVSKKDFAGHMEVLGKMKHDNVVPVRAFYFSKDEKLVVSDYYSGGSLAALLHGKKGGDRSRLDWPRRLKIATAAGRGIAHIHAAANLPHGNIKSTNILLHPTSATAAAVSDYGLNPLFRRATPATRLGYQAPEGEVTFRSDVYSFGVVLLELLTGRAAAAADLPAWVQSVVAEAWTEDVFDEEMLVRGGREKEEMMGLLHVAMSCVATAAEDRPEMVEVLRRLEAVAGDGSPEEIAG